MKKRAQFFILAAVILSAIIISLGVISNKATTNKEPENFYDYTYEIKKESGAIMDWELYSDFDEGANLTEFVDLLAADTMDKYPDANFLFVYGNNELLKLRNYGVDDASVGEDVIAGDGRLIPSSITVTDSSGASVDTLLGSYGFNEAIIENYGNEDESCPEGEICGGRGTLLKVVVSDQDYDFIVTEDNQVLFVIQRNIDGESYVAVE